MVKAGLERFTQGLAQGLQDDKISANVLSLDYVIKTPGNEWATNDPENPDLDFEDAHWMGKAAVWISQQPPESPVTSSSTTRSATGSRTSTERAANGPDSGPPGRRACETRSGVTAGAPAPSTHVTAC